MPETAVEAVIQQKNSFGHKAEDMSEQATQWIMQ